MNTTMQGRELPILDKKTIQFIKEELRLWRYDTLTALPNFPFAGWIDAGLFIESLEILEERAK